MSRGKKRLRYRRLGKLTREGRVFVAVTVGVGIAAVNTGNNLLYLMLGLLLSLLMVSMVMSEVVLHGLRLERWLPEQGREGSLTTVEISVSNTKRWIPSYALEVQDDNLGLESPAGRVHFLKVAGGTRSSARYLRTFPTRGRFLFKQLRVVSRYPFGLVEKTHVHQVEGDILVFPAPEVLDYAARHARSAGIEAPSRRIGHGGEIAGLREYRTGDEARRVHALRSAAMGRWVVREHEEEVRQTLAIALDNRRPDAPPETFSNDFERMVRRAAFVAQDALSKGTSVRVLSAGGHSPAVAPGASLEPVMAFLAELVPAESESAGPVVDARESCVRLQP